MSLANHRYAQFFGNLFKMQIRLQFRIGSFLSMAIYFDPPLANKIDPPDALIG